MSTAEKTNFMTVIKLLIKLMRLNISIFSKIFLLLNAIPISEYKMNRFQ